MRQSQTRTIAALAFPERINVEPTNRCNLRCRWCPYSRMTRPRGFMSLALFRRIAAECAAHGAAVWLQYMGEPLLHPRIVEMISLAKGAGVGRVGLSTNAFFLDEATGLKLLASGLDRLECSVDAADEAGFRASRGSPEFQRVVGNIRGFLRLKQEQGTGKPVTSIQFLARGMRGEDQVPRMVSQWQGVLGPEDFVMSIRDYSFAGSVREPVPDRNRVACRWPFRAAVILWDGTMVLCGSDFDGRAVMGKIGRGSSIAAVWTGAAFEAVRRLHRGRSWDRHPLCRGCDDWRLSDGSGYVNVLKQKTGVRE